MATEQQARAVSDGIVSQASHALGSLRTDHRPHLDVRVVCRTHADRGDESNQFLNEVLIARSLDEDPAGGVAALAGILELVVADRTYALRYLGVFEDQHRRVSAELQDAPLQTAGSLG